MQPSKVCGAARAGCTQDPTTTSDRIHHLVPISEEKWWMLHHPPLSQSKPGTPLLYTPRSQNIAVSVSHNLLRGLDGEAWEAFQTGNGLGAHRAPLLQCINQSLA